MKKNLSLVAIATLLVVITLTTLVSCLKIPKNADDAAQVFKDNECEVVVYDEAQRQAFVDKLWDEDKILIVGLDGYVIATKGDAKAEIFYLQSDADVDSLETYYESDAKDKVTYSSSSTFGGGIVFIGSKELYNLFK